MQQRMNLLPFKKKRTFVPYSTSLYPIPSIMFSTPLLLLSLVSSIALAQTDVDAGGQCGRGFIANSGPQCRPGLVCMPGSIADGPGSCQQPGSSPVPVTNEKGNPVNGTCGGALFCAEGLRCVVSAAGGSNGTCQQASISDSLDSATILSTTTPSMASGAITATAKTSSVMETREYESAQKPAVKLSEGHKMPLFVACVLALGFLF
ncbi:hypothetical protein BC830DRAFT_1149401 [Chytriomyces sp. MP71]|nr:hypothetical protein BC830DRAFT_1149401 [Chytriomyces sp. MP71]